MFSEDDKFLALAVASDAESASARIMTADADRSSARSLPVVA
jgi:hypothetical protein